MTDEEITLFLILKYGSLNHALDLWIQNEINLTNSEKQVIEEYIVKELSGVLKKVKLKEDPRRAEVETIHGSKVIDPDGNFI